MKTKYYQYQDALWELTDTEQGGLNLQIRRFNSAFDTDFPVSEVLFSFAALMQFSWVNDICPANLKKGNHITHYAPTVFDLMSLINDIVRTGCPVSLNL